MQQRKLARSMARELEQLGDDFLVVRTARLGAQSREVRIDRLNRAAELPRNLLWTDPVGHPSQVFAFLVRQPEVLGETFERTAGVSRGGLAQD